MFWYFNNPQNISKLGRSSKSNKVGLMCKCSEMQIWVVDTEGEYVRVLCLVSNWIPPKYFSWAGRVSWEQSDGQVVFSPTSILLLLLACLHCTTLKAINKVNFWFQQKKEQQVKLLFDFSFLFFLIWIQLFCSLVFEKKPERVDSSAWLMLPMPVLRSWLLENVGLFSCLITIWKNVYFSC